MVYLLFFTLVVSNIAFAMQRDLSMSELPRMEMPSQSGETTPLQISKYQQETIDLEKRLIQEANSFEEFQTKSEIEFFHSGLSRPRKQFYFKQKVQQELDKRMNLEETFFVTNEERRWELAKRTWQELQARLPHKPADVPLIKIVEGDRKICFTDELLTFIKTNKKEGQSIIDDLQKERIYCDYYTQLEQIKQRRYTTVVNTTGQICGYGEWWARSMER